MQYAGWLVDGLGRIVECVFTRIYLPYKYTDKTVLYIHFPLAIYSFIQLHTQSIRDITPQNIYTYIYKFLNGKIENILCVSLHLPIIHHTIRFRLFFLLLEWIHMYIPTYDEPTLKQQQQSIRTKIILKDPSHTLYTHT